MAASTSKWSNVRKYLNHPSRQMRDNYRPDPICSPSSSQDPNRSSSHFKCPNKHSLHLCFLSLRLKHSKLKNKTNQQTQNSSQICQQQIKHRTKCAQSVWRVYRTKRRVLSCLVATHLTKSVSLSGLAKVANALAADISYRRQLSLSSSLKAPTLLNFTPFSSTD